MDRGAWLAAVHRIAKSRIRLKQLSTHVPGPNKSFFFKHSTLEKHMAVFIRADPKILFLVLDLKEMSEYQQMS